MNSDECHQRAADCAANAELSPDGTIALEFLKLAGHWRAMAVRQTFLGRALDLAQPLDHLSSPPAS